MKSITTSFFILLVISFARADVNQVVQLELALEKRVKASLEVFDEQAFVTVRVKTHSMNVRLPGTSLEINNFSGGSIEGELSALDISEVQVKIVSARVPFPLWLTQQVQEILKYENILTKIDYQKMDPTLVEQIESRAPVKFTSSMLKSIQNLLTEQSESMKTQAKEIFFWGGAAVLATILIFFGILLFIARRLRVLMEIHVGQLVEAIGEGTPLPSLPAQYTNLKAADTPGLDANHGTQFLPGVLQDLSDSTIRALYSDCYWCEKDSYAKWIWENLTPIQQQSLLKSWKPATEYSRSLSRLDGQNLGLHNHPSYLQTLQLEDISQEDLARWLLQNKGVWHYLSPLRQETMPLTLSDRIACIHAPPPTDFEKLTGPPGSSKRRPLDLVISLNKLTLAEEVQIMENPEIVPAELRNQVPSLAWMKHIPPTVCQEIFEPMNAQDIASAWIGPPELLTYLSQYISEKKRNLVMEYAANYKPSKSSPAFKHMVQKALSVLNQRVSTSGEQHDNAA